MDNNSKRIAKNTIFLYVRMMALMLVSLFTSRVVLDKLGVEDFGIYNVIGGLAVIFGFFSSSLTNATQRFLTVALGNKDVKEGNKIFNQHLLVYGIICLIVILIGESIGPWFINNKMNIPVERFEAANWTFQLSLLSLCATLMGIVFNSTLIAHENMKVYSYIGIVEGFIKLLIVYVLSIVPFDKLITYAILMAIVTLGAQVYYATYCFRSYRECRLHWCWDPKLLRSSFSFIGWNTVGTAESALNEQGIDVLINLFFGPTVNAAKGITGQVSGSIYRFSTNFLISAQPQLVKSYINGEEDYLKSLYFYSSRYAFLLLWIFVCPIMLCIDGILEIWLKVVPEWTSLFIQWSLAGSLFTVLAKPVWFIVIASGRLRKYVIYNSCSMLLIFPLVYVVLKLGYPPVSVYICFFIVIVLNTVIQLILLKDYINYSYYAYFSKVLRPILGVVLISGTFGYFISNFFDRDFGGTFLSCLLIVFSTVLVILSVGISKAEREMVIAHISSKF